MRDCKVVARSNIAAVLDQGARDHPALIVPNRFSLSYSRLREVTHEAAIALAGTGHLCIATLHANNCAETLDRIINMFPRDQHNQIFLDLSQYLRAILSQRLVFAKTGTRVAACEVMMNTPYISELIKKGDVIGVKEAIRTGTERGMLSFDSALYNLVREGRIELEEALSSADSRTNLEAKINFG